jgi:hypothetical protein
MVREGDVNNPALVLGAVLTAALSSAASAQEGPDVSTRQIGVGAQLSPLTETIGPTVSFRAWRGPLGVEAGLGLWKSRDIREYPGLPGARFTDVITRSAFTAGVTVLGRARSGRLAAILGVGPGLFALDTADRTSINGQERFTSSKSMRALGLQSVAELELRATSRFSGFAGLRIEIYELRHPEARAGTLAAGLRAGF